MAGGGGKAKPLEFTPTWIVASVCFIIIIITLLFERLLHLLGKKLSPKKLLYEVLLKVKEELMLLGFISLLLTVFQDPVGKVCVRQSAMLIMLPCKPPPRPPRKTEHLSDAMFNGVMGGARRLLAGGGASEDYCLKKGKVPILSAEAIHQLHIFIFALAVTHVLFSAITVLLGIAQTRNWRHWETNIHIKDASAPEMIKHVQEFKFIQDHFNGHKKRWKIFGWLRSFFKQLRGSVTEEDYTTMRLGFIMKHYRGNPKFNFYSYMIRALEVDFKKVVGISWYLWTMLTIFLLLNVQGWYIYFGISLVPFIVTYGFKSCIMGKPTYVIIRLAISVVSQFLCGYSTLPLYAIVSHMGNSFKKSIFDENVAEGLVNWAENARRRRRMPNKTTIDVGSSPVDEAQGGTSQMVNIPSKSSVEKGTARLI
ncbi:MLO-like protein 1 isoform X2 [Hordeum vulgare subsp. vulgare]|uniref:MLO-like protein n=1 Tax=Hordeum vulgare subsp. vulgare TaxID=112509 RepID=A0A8I7BHZ9_HORVV|nr:MLO-like protein 1 isoform X2 [Hordeum vulgare subsp. vulgare]